MVTRNGRRREIGLGAARDESLAQARAKAEDARRLIREGLDPIEARKAPAAAKPKPSFGAVADEVVASLTPGFRNPEHAEQWATTIGTRPTDRTKVRIDRTAHAAHCEALAALRAKPIDAVETTDVLGALMPLWQAAPETASRVRGRLETVLHAAKVKGLRSGENPARWRGHLDLLLPKRSKLSRGHHAAAPFGDVPTIIARLRATGGISASALEFAILTACRTGEALGATWTEINFGAKVWTIPATRMKAGREHRVPLASRVVEILMAMHSIRHAEDGYVFPGQKRGKPPN
jgi:integrase